jgi:hypothetical protein
VSAWDAWKRPTAPWHELLAPLPAEAEVHRGPLTTPEALAAPGSEAIAGWEQLSVNLTAAGAGLRHVLVVLDAGGRPISIGDAVLYRCEVSAADADRTGDLSPGEIVFYHENIGGRLEVDGSFRGTRWQAFCVEDSDAVELPIRSSPPAKVTEAEARALKALVAEILRRSANSGN